MRPALKRALVDEMRREWSVSIRRACRVLHLDSSTYHYKPRRPGQANLERRIREICNTRVRYGYRRVHVLLRREGFTRLGRATGEPGEVIRCGWTSSRLPRSER